MVKFRNGCGNQIIEKRYTDKGKRDKTRGMEMTGKVNDEKRGEESSGKKRRGQRRGERRRKKEGNAKN